MRHFVQYHNPERMGVYESDGRSFGIQTNKPVNNLLGDRVWLITPSRASRASTLFARHSWSIRLTGIQLDLVRISLWVAAGRYSIR
jgi:hypothetical protein